MRAEKAKSIQVAQQKAAEASYQECLKQRSSLQKISGMVGMSDACESLEPSSSKQKAR
jgi:NTE family protein